jgi:hypothetical protein
MTVKKKKAWQKNKVKLDVAVRACNLGYSGGRDWKHCGLRTKSWQDPMSANELCAVVHGCHSSYERGVGRRITVQG